MAILWNAIASQFNQAARTKLAENKTYQKIKFDLDQTAMGAATVEKVSIVIGLAGVFGLIMLGSSMSAEGRDQLGKALVLSAVPLSILSYDCYQASENYRGQVMENPEGLMVIEDAEKAVKVSRVALRKCLLNKTVLFEPFLELYIKACIKITDLESVTPKIEEA